MITVRRKKTTISRIILCFLLLFAIIVSCKKDIHNETITIPEQVPDLSTKIFSSVSGFVSDENNHPVANAGVYVGTALTVTDQYGYFEVKNVEVVKTAAVVTVTKAGYFNGIKTWAATENKAAFFRIKLLPKTIAGIINTNLEGSVTLANGVTIALPPNAVVFASNNAAFTGDVSVAVQWINPESSELNNIMPGDLRGIDDRGFLKGLTSFGMVAVELTGPAGELLQVAPGKKATISMPLSPALSATAASSIPLWYFDENNGLWKQEGSATKTGNTYVGEVSHFSYWNCDLPNATVPLTFTVVDESSHPIGNIYVDIRPVPGSTNSWSHAGGYTDSSGFVSVFVTPNTSYDLNIYSFTGNCSNLPVFSQAFSVTTTAVTLGNVVVAPVNGSATVSGIVTDCNNNPVTQGNIVMLNGYEYYIYSLGNNGAFNFSTLLCSNGLSVNIVATDIVANQQSLSQSFTLNIGMNNLGTLQACGGSSILPYVSNGYFYHPTAPREIVNLNKELLILSNTSVKVQVGDLPEYAILDVEANYHITVTADPGSSSGPYLQWDAGLPSSSPGPAYTPQWVGSVQCNNTYDPATHAYYLRYGYIGGTGYRVSEEILTPF